ncbi:MAG: haloacid dehalogenase [Porticoccaceae bacterium]|nr:haloacid dehalogenase [Porticoccaceae bacterium]
MIDWNAIDTVLLDMDGTLLDLHFDNFFWQTYLPRRYAEHHGLCPEETTQELHQLFHEKRGTLDWYCLDYWGRELALDIRKLKEEVQHLIRERPHALHFLRQLGAAGKRRVLITNAHRQSLDLKLAITGIGAELDQIISSHDYRKPKESRAFWQSLQEHTGFDPARTLFIDDSEVILSSAQDFGIANLYCIAQPDSQLPVAGAGRFPSIEHFDDILPPTRPDSRSQHG